MVYLANEVVRFGESKCFSNNPVHFQYVKDLDMCVSFLVYIVHTVSLHKLCVQV